MKDKQTYLVILTSVGLSVLFTLAILKLSALYVPELLSSIFPETPQVSEISTGNATLRSGETSIPDVVASAAPAVVSVIISADVPIMERYLDSFDPFGGFFGDFFGFNVPREREVRTERREIGGGTGFFVSEDGYIITNRHVVDIEGAEFSIVTDDGTSYEADVVAMDPVLDIAVLKVDDGRKFAYLEFGNPDSVRLGEQVIAIGNALAEFPNSVSVGVVSGLSRDVIAGDRFGSIESLEGVIQTDAAINQGNSGGPLLDLSGRVIGVNVAVAGNSENIGFALPIEPVRQVYESVREHGEIIRPFVGIRYVQITEALAERNNLSVDYGILILRGNSPEELAVIPGSAADRAGLTENDIILEIDGKKLDGTKSFAGIIREYNVGDTVTLKVLHDGEEREVSITLQQAPN